MYRMVIHDALTAVVLLSIVSCTGDNPVTPDETIDGFPLAVGSRFTYSYVYWNYGNVDYQWIDLDSGVVDYRIRDSATTSSFTRKWTAEEVRHLLHYHYKPWDTLKTARWEDSTVIVSLIEGLSGSHELQCGGLIWDFPFKNILGPSTISPISIFRYVRDPNRMLTSYYDAGDEVAVQSDTMRFDTAKGMTYRHHVHSGSAMSAPRTNLTVVLTGIAFDQRPADMLKKRRFD